MAESADSNLKSPGTFESFQPQGHMARFSGERLLFDISFLMFENAAVAEATFFENGGRYYATLTAETQGVVGFFSSHRKHIYKSSFDLIDNGQRVRTRRFEREVTIGDDTERTLHYIDYKSRKHIWLTYKNDELLKQEQEPIPEGVFFDDILAAFYNFRNSVYGPLEPGRKFKIDTIPDQNMRDISIYIFTDQEKEAIRKKEGKSRQNDMLMKVVIPKEVFKTKSGELIFWGSPHYVPLESTVKDYILLGDLHVKFRERITKHSSRKSASR